MRDRPPFIHEVPDVHECECGADCDDGCQVCPDCGDEGVGMGAVLHVLDTLLSLTGATTDLLEREKLVASNVQYLETVQTCLAREAARLAHLLDEPEKPDQRATGN